MTGPGLTALVVDDERPALSELAWLLDQDERVAEVIQSWIREIDLSGNVREAVGD